MMQNEQEIYADYAATSPLIPCVCQAMMPFLQPGSAGNFGNPSSLHRPGRRAFDALSGFRAEIAALFGCQPQEIVFTSGATEADNLAIKGLCRGRRGGHIVSTAIEHPAVLRTCDAAEREGFAVTRVLPNPDGTVSPERVRAAIRPDTFLVSVMAANNETGAVNDIRAIAGIAHENGCLFFTDAVQRIPFCDPAELIPHADLLSLSGHKLGAPKGIGLLYVRAGTPLSPVLDGGGQERGLRSGTENLPYIAGLAAALSEAKRRLPEAFRVAALRDRLEEGILRLPGTQVCGSRTARMPGHLNVIFRGIPGESLMLLLAAAGIAVSTASACTASAAEPSHVLLAMGKSPEEASSAVRFSLSYQNTDAEITRILTALNEMIRRRGNVQSEPRFSCT